MLAVTGTEVYGLEWAAAAAGLPMAATTMDVEELEKGAGEVGQVLRGERPETPRDARHIARLSRLARCAHGTGHDNALCGVVVQADFTAPRFWWHELQRYHFVDIVSATSTMHRLLKAVEDSRDNPDALAGHFDAGTPTAIVEAFRKLALEVTGYEDMDEAGKLHCLKCALPEGWLQTARVTTNYRQLRTMWMQRRNHTLPEWRRDFTGWVGTLPLSHLITGGEDATARADAGCTV